MGEKGEEMRRSITLGIYVLGAAACGSDGWPVEGTWATATTTRECVFALTIESTTFRDGQYETDLLCELTDGSIGLEAEVGTIQRTGENEYFSNPAQSTCSGKPALFDPASFTSSIERTGNTIRIVEDDGILLLERLKVKARDSQSGFIEFGCFDTSANFTPCPAGPI